MKENNYNKEKLIYELKKYASQFPKPTIGKKTPINTKTTEPKESTTKPVIVPVEKKVFIHHEPEQKTGFQTQLDQEKKELYRKRGHFHGQLHNCKTDEERFEIAEQIIATQKEIDKTNKSIKQASNGEVPTVFVKETQSAEQFVQIRNLKLYISRTKKELETANPAKRAKLEKKLADFEETLKSLLS